MPITRYTTISLHKLGSELCMGRDNLHVGLGWVTVFTKICGSNWVQIMLIYIWDNGLVAVCQVKIFFLLMTGGVRSGPVFYGSDQKNGPPSNYGSKICTCYV